MTQICIDAKTPHEPVIERYYDDDQPSAVLRIFRCQLCAHILDKDLVDKDDDHEDDIAIADKKLLTK